MDRLWCSIKNYAWGSRTALAELAGRGAPSALPEAELWVGAHPAGPCELERGGARRTLAELIAADPERELGPALAARGEGALPLLKLLAAGRPLSLQAHPDRDAAERGFAREQAAGLPLGDARRSYKDPLDKPELVVALGPFHALAGLREPAASLAELSRAGLAHEAWLEPLASALAAGQLTRALELAFELAAARPDELERLSRAHPRLAALAAHYPRDPGLLVSLLLEPVSLERNEALFLGPRALHAYLGGLAVEVMRASDNVLRGGLTDKHVDVAELVRVLDGRVGGALRIEPRRLAEGRARYEPPTDAFALERLEPLGSALALEGPALVVCVRGRVALRAGDALLELSPTQAGFVPASDGVVLVEGHGELFAAVPAGPAATIATS